jgi:glycerol-3-phosphate acyltransferase PlsY
MAFRLICLLIGYLFGCFQTSYIVGRLTHGIDIREHGSKNAGMTNSLRVMGRKAGAVVFLGDVTKALLAFFMGSYFFEGDMFAGLYVLPGLYAGLGAVLGHNFPFFLKFKGGKGVASTLAVMLGINWQAALIVYALGISAIIATRYISLASMFMTAAAPVLFWLFGLNLETILVSAVMGVMAWVLHRENIKRLIRGTENKFSLKGSKK